MVAGHMSVDGRPVLVLFDDPDCVGRLDVRRHAVVDDAVRVIEQYEDGAAVDAHMSSDHFESFQAAIASHLAGEPELYRYEVDSETQVM